MSLRRDKQQWQTDHPVAGQVFSGGARRPPRARVYPDWWSTPEGRSPLGIRYQCPHDPLCTVSGWANWDCGMRQLGEP